MGAISCTVCNSVTDAGLIGGGTYPGPSEKLLTANGVLFLGELPEFKSYNRILKVSRTVVDLYACDRIKPDPQSASGAERFSTGVWTGRIGAGKTYTM